MGDRLCPKRNDVIHHIRGASRLLTEYLMTYDAKGELLACIIQVTVRGKRLIRESIYDL